MDTKVLLHSSLNRDELFTWMDRVYHDNPGETFAVHTWTITDHPAPDGSVFDLHIATLIQVERKYVEEIERLRRELQVMYGSVRNLVQNARPLLADLERAADHAYRVLSTPQPGQEGE